jgi:pimeloyl-ACP methyl ester carboxylesterase
MLPLAQGFNIFYREARPTDAQTLLLLHGYPSVSHMFRHLVPGGELSDEFAFAASLKN